ncbi:MAG: CopG family transcriptional regulator [Salinigranum sp.]
MSREQAETLPEDLRDWLDRKADDLGTDPEEVLVRAVAAYRLVDENHERLEDARGNDLTDRLEGLTERVTAVEADLDEKIQDVRERVVQVKREADAKAPADHDHAELADRVDDAAERTEELDALVADLEAQVESGFENYESILEYLAETTDDLNERLERLARAVIDARVRIGELESEATERAAVAEIQSEANRHGATAARCGECSAAVGIGLLSKPRCPHCGATFASFEPARGFFGSATLIPGRLPALEGDREPEESAADLIGERTDAPVADLFAEDDDD